MPPSIYPTLSLLLPLKKSHLHNKCNSLLLTSPFWELKFILINNLIFFFFHFLPKWSWLPSGFRYLLIYFFCFWVRPLDLTKNDRHLKSGTHTHTDHIKIIVKHSKIYLITAIFEQRHTTAMDPYCRDHLIKIHMTHADCIFFFYFLIYVCGFVVVFVVLPMIKQNLVHTLPYTICKNFFFSKNGP